MEVLVVCTGNICRSPMAAGMLRELLADAGVPARVTSAGFVTEDRPASAHGVSVMAKRGVDLREHRSQRVSPEHLASADLVLCMERAHVREIALLDADAFRRTFTLPELVRNAVAVGPRRQGETIESWITRVGGARRPSDLLAERPEDEIPDPYGRPKREYRRTADQLDELLRTLVDHLFPAGHRTAAAG